MKLISVLVLLVSELVRMIVGSSKVSISSRIISEVFSVWCLLSWGSSFSV